MNKQTVNVSYLAPTQIDRSFELEVLAIAKTFDGSEEGGSGFCFEDNRRDFDIEFPDVDLAEKFLKRLARIKRYKVKGSL